MSNIITSCPICDGSIIIPKDTEESEILICSECDNRVVVTKINKKKVELEEAPQIEEDWGE